MNKIDRRLKRVKAISKRVKGTLERPRLVVNRSNAHIYAQIIDDVNHITIASCSDKSIDKKVKPLELAKEVGLMLGKKAVEAKVSSVVFDRRGFKYHGRIKALADGAREAGLQF